MITTNAATGHTLLLGREGENLARSMIFDIADWISAYGDGTVSLIAQRSGDTEPYPCTVTVDGSSVTWEVTAADTARNGYGKCELRYAVGDVLAKSETWRTYTADALGTPAPEPPEPQKAWVDKVLEAGQAAVDASVNSPKIGSNGNWWTWDFEAGKYVDTGVAASGGGSGAVSSVNGKIGAVKLTAEDVGAVPAPATASVGQTIVVKAVDETGRPTEWEARDSMPATGAEDAGKVLTVTDAGVPGWAEPQRGDSGYRFIAGTTLLDNIRKIEIASDSDGKALSLKTARIFVIHPVPNDAKIINGYVQMMDTDGTVISFGAVKWKIPGYESIAVADFTVYGDEAPAMLTFSDASKIQIGAQSPVSRSCGNKLSHFDKIEKITLIANGVFEAGTRIIIFGKNVW